MPTRETTLIRTCIVRRPEGREWVNHYTKLMTATATEWASQLMALLPRVSLCVRVCVCVPLMLTMFGKPGGEKFAS